MPIRGPEEKYGDVVCGVTDDPKSATGPEETKGVGAREGTDPSKPTIGPEDLKGAEDCKAVGKDEVGLPGTVVCSIPSGC